MNQPTLFDLDRDDGVPAPPDQAARNFAVDPANDVVLEASAGTGKTRVLVDRYVRLVTMGVEPRNILAITFTRKAAAEMRGRVLDQLRRLAETGAISTARWRALWERIGDIQISTIDAFCFSLLREFPLEANVDPAFDIADETEMARFAREALDLTARAARSLIEDDECVRLLFTRVKGPALTDAVASLLDRRHIALPAVASFVRRYSAVGDAAAIAASFVRRIAAAVDAMPNRSALLEDGPHKAASFRWLAGDLGRLKSLASEDPGRVQQFRRRLERYFLTKDGKARQRISRTIQSRDFSSPDARKRHERALGTISRVILEEIDRLDRDLNVLLARGLLRILAIAVGKYEQLLEDNALLDFAGMLDRSVALLARQEEFARSRLKLQARHHHVLVDEFQDTSRLQWRLVDLLINAWGEGEGMSDAPTSIFIVGDRKQSIYRFRHAEVTLLDEAARRIGMLRPGRTIRQAITTSFRAVPELLAFVNALSGATVGADDLDDRFSYGDADRFPVEISADGARRDGQPVLGLIAESSMAAAAAAVAEEASALIGTAIVRDRSGAARPARPDDIAILFRARAGHQYFEEALELRGVRTYVYKGLGFFDAPEVQDLEALLRYLAAPHSDLRAAELLRSRLVRLSDIGLAKIAPSFAATLRAQDPTASLAVLEPVDRAVLERARASVARWLELADRVPPSELIDQILAESAYVYEMRGRRLDQARENVKKVRALIRRVENRGYATLARIAAYFETLGAGDEANAIVEASGAVNLMTIHAAKGLEFPIVFLVNLHAPGRGRPGGFSVIDRGPNGEPEVAFNETDATRLEDRRELEELRRLLYVATTRARDRLYLAGELQKGKLVRPGRSLASLLPASLADAFAAAAMSPALPEVTWTANAEERFAFRVCRPSPEKGRRAQLEVPDSAVPPVIPITALGRRHIAATGLEPGPVSAERSLYWAPAPNADAEPMVDLRMVGTLVHRLFQRSVPTDMDVEALGATAETLVRPEERVDIDDLARVALKAGQLYRAFRTRQDVREILERGRCLYEVPFSYEPPDRSDDRLRGAIDCLVVADDGSATVVEFKTGAPKSEHQVQADVYGAAIKQALGLPAVEICVLYA